MLCLLIRANCAVYDRAEIWIYRGAGYRMLYTMIVRLLFGGGHSQFHWHTCLVCMSDLFRNGHSSQYCLHTSLIYMYRNYNETADNCLHICRTLILTRKFTNRVYTATCKATCCSEIFVAFSIGYFGIMLQSISSRVLQLRVSTHPQWCLSGKFCFYAMVMMVEPINSKLDRWRYRLLELYFKSRFVH